MQMQQSLADLYEHYWEVPGSRFDRLDESLNPRGPFFLLDLTDDLGLQPSSTILDLGCGRGHYAVELATRHGCHVVAIDPVDRHLTNAAHLVAEAGLRERVTVRGGRMESIPLADATVDLIWCRGVLPHVADVNAGLVECRRVLCTQAHMLLLTAFATPLLEPQEAQALSDAMALQTRSMCREYVEQAITATGFRIVQSESLGSEFAEYHELQEGRCSRMLLRLARLLRQPDRFVREFRTAAFRTAVGHYHWTVYQLLGKISYHMYLLQKSS